MSRGRTTSTVEARWRQFDWHGRPAVQVVIHDNGPGCPAGIRERLFEPFFTTKPKGTGMGMAICHRIVEAHDGSIQVSCNGNAGFQVTIQLPKVRP